MSKDDWDDIEKYVNEEGEYEFYQEEWDKPHKEQPQKTKKVSSTPPIKKDTAQNPENVAAGCLGVSLIWAVLIFVVWLVGRR